MTPEDRNPEFNAAHPTVIMPVPMVAPLGIPVTAEGVQDVWDTFIVTDQKTEVTQSMEMRCLMAILRSAYVALGGTQP